MVNTYWHVDLLAHSVCLDKLRDELALPHQNLNRGLLNR
jgi:hypothetical protein